MSCRSYKSKKKGKSAKKSSKKSSKKIRIGNVKGSNGQIIIGAVGGKIINSGKGKVKISKVKNSGKVKVNISKIKGSGKGKGKVKVKIGKITAGRNSFVADKIDGNITITHDKNGHVIIKHDK